jgi:hypothetical protein
MSTQHDAHHPAHPAIDASKRANDLAKKLTQVARIQASSLHSSASSLDSTNFANVVASAGSQAQDVLNEQVLTFCSRVPALLSSCGLLKPSDPALANQEALSALMRIAEQANKSLPPSQNFAIVERMFDSLLKHHAKSVADQEESKVTIQKLLSELARSKRDDLLRSWQEEAKRNSEYNQARIQSLEQEILNLKNAAKEFDAKVSFAGLRTMQSGLSADFLFPSGGKHRSRKQSTFRRVTSCSSIGISFCRLFGQ